MTKQYLAGEHVYLISVILLGLVIRILSANWAETFSTDVYYYVVKAIEITRGNTQHLPELSIGWPYILAAVFAFVRPASYASAVVTARIMSLVFDTATALVLFRIAAEVYGRTGRYAAVTAYVCLPLSVIIASSGMPDSAFVFFLVIGVRYIMKTGRSVYQYVAAGAAGAACVWLRPNGILVVPLFAGIAWLAPNTSHLSAWKRAAVVTAACVLLSIPMWAGRAIQYGNPFSYGAATKVFIGSLDASLSPNIKNPPVGEFLRQTTPATLVNRYVLSFVREFARAAAVPFTVFDLLSAMIFAGSVLVLFIPKKPVRIRIAAAVCVYWAVFLVPTLPVHQKARHLLPLVPFAILTAAYTYGYLYRQLTGRKTGNALVYVLLFIVAAGAIGSSLQISSKIRTAQSYDSHDWAEWSATHLSGLVVTTDTFAVQQYLIDRTLADTSNSHILNTPEHGLQFSFPGYFSSFPEEIAWLRSMHASYIVIDREYLRRAGYLQDIASGKEQNPSLTRVYDNNDSRNPWKVAVFAVH